MICVVKQKTAYEVRISDWSSDVCSSDLAEVGHHREALLLGEGLDGMADVAQRRAGLHHLDAAHHGFVGHLDQAAGDDLRLADEEHAAGVAVPTVDDDGDVDVDDVAVVETLVVAGNAVADDVVHRGADRNSTRLNSSH